MKRVEKALKSFNEGNTCSQAILSTYAEDLGLEKELALKLSCSFGGGMGCMGSICGAVTGAYMVLGLKHGRVDPDDISARNKSDELVRIFTEKFKQRNNDNLNCNDLLGYERSNDEHVKILKEKGIFDRVCPKCVKDAAEIIEEIL